MEALSALLLFIASTASAEIYERAPAGACAEADDACRLAAAKAAVAARPKDARAHLDFGYEQYRAWKGDHLAVERDYEERAATFFALNESMALNPSYDALVVRGLAYMNRHKPGGGDAKKGVADLTLALALKPNDAATHFYRGGAYHVDKNWRKAISDYTRALALDPQYPYAAFQLGRCQMELKNYSGALEAFNRAIATQGDSAPHFYYFRSDVHKILGNAAASAADRKTAESFKPKK